MSRSIERIVCLLLCGLGSWAQQEAPKIVVNVEGFRYPPVAGTARIRGDVVFEVSASGRRLVGSASAILSKPAEANLETWTLPPLEAGSYLVTYHFELLESWVTHKTVLVGTKFERFFRRLVGVRTEKIVDIYCHPFGDPTADPPARYTLVKDVDVKIDVFVGAAPRCLTTEAAQIARNSHL